MNSLHLQIAIIFNIIFKRQKTQEIYSRSNNIAITLMKLLEPWKTDQVPPIWHMVRFTSDFLCSSIPFLVEIPWFMWLSYNDMIRWRVPCEQILMPTFLCKCCHHWHSERLILKNLLIENYPRHHPSILFFIFLVYVGEPLCFWGEIPSA